MLSEFGGISYSVDPRAWGDSKVDSVRELENKYIRLLAVVNSLNLLAGYCYTQFADTYQEANGLLFADRTPKIPIDHIARATVGTRKTDDQDVIVGSHPHPIVNTEPHVPVPAISDDDPH